MDLDKIKGIKMKWYQYILSIMGVILIVTGSIWYSFTQKYVQDSPITATTGIIWKKTLNLKEYKNISSGNNIWGKYDSYSRSDRHTEVLTIYCRNFCKK